MKNLIYILFILFTMGMVTNSFGQTVIIKEKEFLIPSMNKSGIKIGVHILDNGNYKFLEGTKARDVEGNMRLLNKVLTEYFDKGYKITHSSAGGATYLTVTTYILTKE